MESGERIGAEAVAATVEVFREELVRRYGEPWFREREDLVERLGAALVARTREPAARAALARRWCAKAIPQLERWLVALEASAPLEHRPVERTT